MSAAGMSPHCKPLKELIEALETNPSKGLLPSELGDRYLLHGHNELPRVKKSIWKVYLAPIFNFLIVILLITGVIVILLGNPEATIITFTVVIINSTTAIIQQYRAQKALESLREISSLTTNVIRDGQKMEIDTRDLVPGDIVLIEQGDKMPADGRVMEETNLTVNEAPLTGESEPVEKHPREHRRVEEGHDGVDERDERDHVRYLRISSSSALTPSVVSGWTTSPWSIR